MDRIGTVAEIWRYPVKSMRGERLTAGMFDRTGLEGDRRFAVTSTAAPRGKPLLSSRERTAMLRYGPRLEPVAAVTTPEGLTFPLPSPALLAHMEAALANDAGNWSAQLGWQVSPQRPLTDVRPVALLSTATLTGLSRELGRMVAAQRFRSNLILALDSPEPFAEDALTGATLCFGEAGAHLQISERIPRCRMVSLDPETTEVDPQLLRHLAKQHEGRLGIYATVVQAGAVRVGDAVVLG